MGKDHNYLQNVGISAPRTSKFYNKMNVSAHEAEIAISQFSARIIDIAHEKQWSGDPSHPMRLMTLGGMGGIPKLLIFLSNINDSGEKLESGIFSFVRGNIHLCCNFDVLKAEIHTIPYYL